MRTRSHNDMHFLRASYFRHFHPARVDPFLHCPYTATYPPGKTNIPRIERKHCTMTRIHSYMTFNGNCREAMQFYQRSLGGELVLQTIGDSPLSDKMPRQMKES